MNRSRVLTVFAAMVLAVGALVVTSDQADAILLQGTFVDDNQSPHQNGIEAIAALSITSGCNPPTNNRFCPDRDMTRAETATFMTRAYGYSGTSTDFFIDDNGHPLENGINRLAAAGITSGCNPPANDRYCPDRSLTRAEFAAFIVRAENLPHSSTDYFTDDNGHVLENAINAMAQAGITVGCNPPANDRYCPNRVLSRGETATFLTRALTLDHQPQAIPLTNWSPITCAKNGITCSMNVETFSGRTHSVSEGLVNALPYAAGEQNEFLASNTRFTLSLNGSAVALSEHSLQTTSSLATRRWSTTLVFPNGNHTLVAEWRRNGVLVQRTTVNLDVN